MTIERRSFLSAAAAIAASPLALIGQDNAPASAKAVRLARGEDRLGEHHAIGVSRTDFKVLTKDSRGDLFVMEHTSRVAQRCAYCALLCGLSPVPCGLMYARLAVDARV